MDLTELTLSDLAARYREGRTTPLDAARVYLEKLESGPVYRRITAERALEQAASATEKFAHGLDTGPLQGIPIAVKDLIGTEGEVSVAGAKVLEDTAPELEDSPVAARLAAAGAVFLGKTTMTELAFSGLGINPHYGTPANAFDPARVPGGSSSGSAVAVAKGLACVAVGSDTGGSVRIPAAFNGLVGLKTTDGAIPTDGCVALSFSLDTLGPLARTVQDAWSLWRAMRALPGQTLQARSMRGLRVLVPETVVMEGLESEVERAFEFEVERLRAHGAVVVAEALPLLREITEVSRRYGSFAGHESHALYRDLIAERGDAMDPRVTTRIMQNRDRSSFEYLRLLLERKRIRREFGEVWRRFDLLALPTVAILPPRLDDLRDDDAYFRANAQVLRNTSLFNFLGLPALSLPAGPVQNRPVGFMLVGPAQSEDFLLAVGASLEAKP